MCFAEVATIRKVNSVFMSSFQNRKAKRKTLLF